jgi:diguanylate cyclase (GGDEF)-like protein
VTEQRFRILVVDDTADVRDLLRFTLLARGYDCLIAEDGPDGLDQAERFVPDLILLDLMMPGMDGYEVCQRLKQSPTTRRIPVIFLTARAEVPDRVRGLTLGAVDYIPKPFDPRELAARVDVALRTKQALDSLERTNVELRTSSSTDELTGLYNRRYFEQRVFEELANPARNGVPAACLMLDLDYFKQINDTHGHLSGDAVLRGFAQIITRITRKGDLAARFGGEEFVMLLTGVTPIAARAAAEKIRASVQRATFPINGASLKITTSIGVACFQLGRQTPLQYIVDQADRALYRAKRTRNRVEVVELG